MQDDSMLGEKRTFKSLDLRDDSGEEIQLFRPLVGRTCCFLEQHHLNRIPIFSSLYFNAIFVNNNHTPK